MRERQLIIRPRPVERACVCVLLILPLYVRKYIFIRRLPSRQRFCIPSPPPSHSPTHAATATVHAWLAEEGGGILWPWVCYCWSSGWILAFLQVIHPKTPLYPPSPPSAVPVYSCIPRQNLITFVFCPCAKCYSRYFWQVGAQMWIYLFRSLPSSTARRV
jgi:hypothetical protein